MLWFLLYHVNHLVSLSYFSSAPTVAPSGLGGGGGDHNELIITWTVSGKVKMILCSVTVKSLEWMGVCSQTFDLCILKTQTQNLRVSGTNVVALRQPWFNHILKLCVKKIWVCLFLLLYLFLNPPAYGQRIPEWWQLWLHPGIQKEGNIIMDSDANSPRRVLSICLLQQQSDAVHSFWSEDQSL